MKIEWNPWNCPETVTVVIDDYALLLHQETPVTIWRRYPEFEKEEKYNNEDGECWRMLNSSYILEEKE